MSLFLNTLRFSKAQTHTCECDAATPRRSRRRSGLGQRRSTPSDQRERPAERRPRPQSRAKPFSNPFNPRRSAVARRQPPPKSNGGLSRSVRLSAGGRRAGDVPRGRSDQLGTIGCKVANSRRDAKRNPPTGGSKPSRAAPSRADRPRRTNRRDVFNAGSGATDPKSRTKKKKTTTRKTTTTRMNLLIVNYLSASLA